MKKEGLYFESSGRINAPAIVMLHGFMGSSGDWKKIACKFSDKYRCIRIDLPGHGHSLNINKESYTIDNTAREVIKILDAIGVEKFNLLGYSMGGRLALYIATHYPERIEKLIIESASPGLKTPEERRERIKSDSLIIQKLKTASMEDFIDEWYSMPLFGNIKSTDKYKKIFKARMKNKPKGLIRSLKFMGTGRQPSLWDEWQKLKIKTLLISGENDSKFCGIAKEMAELNPFAEHIIIPGVFHNTHFDNRKKFIKYALDFIKNSKTGEINEQL